MHDISKEAFLDELGKIASIDSLWENFKNLFRSEPEKAKREVKEHYRSTDPKRWDRFINNATSPEFVKQLKRSRKDPKDILHAANMGALKIAPVSGTIESTSDPGTKYQVKKLPSGNYGCTCNDWRYKGSVQPGYECKHIRAHKSGLNKVANFREMTTSFFDELQKIRDEERKKIYKGSRADFVQTAKPYSDLLTPGETTYYNLRPATPMEDPEVIVGGGLAK